MRAAVFLILASSALGATNYRDYSPYPEVQKELVDHYFAAQNDLARGDYAKASARADLVTPGRRVLSVELNYESGSQGREAETVEALTGALKMWRNAMGEKLFRIAKKGESADIQITFKPEVFQDGVALGGFVNWTRKLVTTEGVAETTADIQVRTVQPDGDQMTVQQMRHELAHELGHVLGLVDSCTSGRVMSGLNLNAPVSMIRPSDIQGLVKLRQDADSLRRVALNPNSYSANR